MLSSATGLADRVAPQQLIAVGTVAAAIFNAGLLLPGCTFPAAVALRVGSGAAMSIVYPPACKFAASWFVCQAPFSSQHTFPRLVQSCQGQGGDVRVIKSPALPRFVAGRGVAMGCVIAALTVGSAVPHLLNATLAVGWQTLVLVCSLTSASGGVLAVVALRPGPHLTVSRPTARQAGWREVRREQLSPMQQIRAVLTRVAY